MSNQINILFITSNTNKLNEAKQIMSRDLNNVNFESYSIDLPEMQGEMQDISRQKCTHAVHHLLKDSELYNKYKNYHVITEDVSLSLNGLNGLPGPYIKWFVNRLGVDGIYKMLLGFDDKRASAYCCISYSPTLSSLIKTDNIKQHIGIVIGMKNGKIVEPRYGENKSFGWDSIFQPDSHDKTYAELDKEYKNKISHRYDAFERLGNIISY